MLFAGNGRQAISAVITALVPPGGRLGVEELTYPVIKAVAARLAITLVPLAMDEDGLIPEAVAEAHAAAPLHAVYVQPRLHNPLSLTMPEQRIERLAEVLLRLGLPAVEDAIWAFLRDELPPLAAYAPERTVLIDSLSKRIAPGLTLGFAVAPPALTSEIAVSLRSGGWSPMRFALEAAHRWQQDGTVKKLVVAKQREAAVRQEIAARHLDGFAVRSHPRSYHCWWQLPRPWRADTFVAAAARHGIGVVPAAAFTVGGSQAPNAVRLGLASPAAGGPGAGARQARRTGPVRPGRPRHRLRPGSGERGPSPNGKPSWGSSQCGTSPCGAAPSGAPWLRASSCRTSSCRISSCRISSYAVRYRRSNSAKAAASSAAPRRNPSRAPAASPAPRHARCIPRDGGDCGPTAHAASPTSTIPGRHSRSSAYDQCGRTRMRPGPPRPGRPGQEVPDRRTRLGEAGQRAPGIRPHQARQVRPHHGADPGQPVAGRRDPEPAAVEREAPRACRPAAGREAGVHGQPGRAPGSCDMTAQRAVAARGVHHVAGPYRAGRLALRAVAQPGHPLVLDDHVDRGGPLTDHHARQRLRLGAPLQQEHPVAPPGHQGRREKPRRARTGDHHVVPLAGHTSFPPRGRCAVKFSPGGEIPRLFRENLSFHRKNHGKHPEHPPGHPVEHGTGNSPTAKFRLTG